MPAKDIDKIYFITHPAFHFLHEEMDIEKFVKTGIEPVIKRAQAEPNSLVVLLKTPLKQLPNHKLDPEAVRRVEEIETKLEKFARRMIKRRCIILHKADSPLITATNVEEIAKARGFQIKPSTRIEGHGTWRKFCAHTHPELFRRFAGINRRISVQIHGTLPKPKKLFRAK